jgi:hypothetical protein
VQLFDVVMDTAMRTVETKMPGPRAIAICAKCPWVVVNKTSSKDLLNVMDSSLDWFAQRCSAAHVKDIKDGGRLVKNENYGKPTGTINGCKEWV